MFLLLPSPKLWGPDEVIVSQSKKSYTSCDYEALFVDMNYTDGSRIYHEVQNLTTDFPAPNVTHYCFYGTDVRTVSTFVYGDSFPDQAPESKEDGNGDGIVNFSLAYCGRINKSFLL